MDQLRGRVPILIGGKYEVLAPLGSGGMSDVFKVRHVELDTIRALKVMPHGPTRHPELVTRFRREAKKMATFRHEHIVQVYDFGRDGDLFYLVLDFIDGTTLGERLRTEGPLDVATALRIAIQMADALVYAHGVGVTHRDVKPSNILIERHPPRRALLIDFGIAKVVDDGDHTRADVLLGTPRYSAPEQLGYRRGGARIEVDQRADVYALGLVLYEMLEGEALLADLTPAEIMMRVAIDPEPLRAAFTVPVPDIVCAIVDRAITRDPDDRFQSMQEMLAALLACAPPAEALEPSASGDGVRVPAGLAIEAIDAHIQALEAEKQQQLVRAAETAAERARRDASSSDAPTLAPEAWAEAAAAVAEAHEAAREGRHHAARDAFNLAAQRFQQAASEAGARRREQFARLARDEMRAARREAEAADAARWTATELAAAVSREQEADQAFAAGRHEDAQRSYVEARVQYGATRIAAVEAERRDRLDRVERARASAADARRHAEASGTREWAAAANADAGAQMARAEAASTRGDDVEAVQTFTDAAAAFTDAARQAVGAQALAQAAAEAARAELVRLVDEVHARLDAAELGSGGVSALHLRDEGASALAAGEYHRATARFEAAAAALRDAAEQAEATRRARASIPVAPEPDAVPCLPLAPPPEPLPEALPERVVYVDAPTWMMHADGSPLAIDVPPPSTPPDVEDWPSLVTTVAPAATVLREPATAIVLTHRPPARPAVPGRWAIALAGGLGVAALVYVTTSTRTTRPPAPLPAPTERSEARPAPNRPPFIVSQNPAAPRLALDEGETARFEVRGNDPDEGPEPAVTWHVDGQEAGRGPQWQLVPPSPKTGSARHVVEAELRDPAGASARTRWDVDVAATAPRIMRSDPSSPRLRMTPGEPRVLRVEAKSGNGEPLQFEWLLDRGPVVRTAEGRFAVPADLEGTHQIEVAAIDTRGLRGKTTVWTLLIEPTATPPSLGPQPTTPLPTVPPATPAPTQLTEADVRDWLGRVERAYEARNPHAIIELGVVKPSQLPTLEAQIGRYRTLEVDIMDAKISLEGGDATVSFKRTDRDETGRVLDLPRQKFRLRRGPGGVTAERLD